MSSLIPGTRTAGSLSGPRNPCTVGVMGSPNAPWTEYVDDLDVSVIFHCSPTPEMPAPESRICREDLAWTVIIRLISLVMSRFIRGFFVGEEYLVTVRLSCASNVTSMLGMGREDEDVDTEVGTGGSGESELSDSDSDGEE